MRLIDADALKEAVNKKKVVGRFNMLLLIDNAPTVKAFTVDEVEEIRQATMEQVRISCKQNERPQGEWIPVSERLPEQNGVYITTCRDICGNRVHAVAFDGVRKKWGRGGVIAWQPSLPEPYKEEGEEE